MFSIVSSTQTQSILTTRPTHLTPCRSFPGGTSDFVTVDPKSTHETRHVIDAGEHPSMGSAKAEFNDAQYVKDLRGAFSSVPRPKARWQDRYMKLMIVGETGQGRIPPLLSNTAGPGLYSHHPTLSTLFQGFLQRPAQAGGDLCYSHHEFHFSDG